MAVLNELSGCFEMNIPYEVIASVVRRQLSEGVIGRFWFTVLMEQEIHKTIFHEPESICYGSGYHNRGESEDSDAKGT